MASMRSVAPFGQHEVHVHSVDDAAGRQQKMLQQRQLALKRQQHFAKSSIGAGVTAQHDIPFDAASPQKKAAGWEKMLMRCGIDVGVDGVACSPEMIPSDTPSGFMRIRVPFANDESFSTLRTSSQPSPTSLALEATCQDFFHGKADQSNSDAGDQQLPSETSKPTTPQLSEVDGSSDSQSQTKAQEKSRGFKLWRPWGASKRTNIVETETIVEEKRASLNLSDTAGAGERCTTLSIGRASTPFQHGEESVLEESIGSDLSSIPGFTEAGDDALDDSMQGVETLLDDNDDELVDGDNDNDSVESGIENTVMEWKEKENDSPNGKRNRFNRFLPSVPAPHFWRNTKAEESITDNSVTRILVTPRVSIEVD